MARNIAEVIYRIENAIPTTFPEREALCKALNSVAYNARFTAPEVMWMQWANVAELLDRYLGEPDEPWKLKVVFVVTGKEISYDGKS